MAADAVPFDDNALDPLTGEEISGRRAHQPTSDDHDFGSTSAHGVPLILFANKVTLGRGENISQEYVSAIHAIVFSL